MLGYFGGWTNWRLCHVHGLWNIVIYIFQMGKVSLLL